MGVVTELRVDRLDFTRNAESGKLEFSGSYSLVSPTGIALAKESFNGYNSLKVGMSGDGLKQVNTLLKTIKTELQGLLGIEEGEK